MKQRSTQKALETSSTISVWNWKNSKNKRSKNQRKKNVSKRISNKPLMPVADYSAEEVKFLYESKSGKTTRNSMNFDHNSMNFDHQQIQLPATAQWVILPLFFKLLLFQNKIISRSECYDKVSLFLIWVKKCHLTFAYSWTTESESSIFFAGLIFLYKPTVLA